MMNCKAKGEREREREINSACFAVMHGSCVYRTHVSGLLFGHAVQCSAETEARRDRALRAL